MVQSGSSLGFALEAAESLSVSCNIVGQELEGNKPTEFHILGLVHDTHAATANLLDDAVVRDVLADHWRECYVSGTGKSTRALELGAPPKGSSAEIRVLLNRTNTWSRF